MIHISASLLAADYARLGEEVQRAELAGADSFHIDIMDGHYVRNYALAPDHIKVLRSLTRLPFHAHLEVENPDDVLSEFEPILADMIIIQWDTLKDPARVFERIHSQDRQVGLGLCPDDDIDEASRYFQDIDMFLLLGVYPGFGGQAMQPDTLERLVHARQLIDQCGRQIRIAVDGGVKSNNASELVKAGADTLIMGTALFQSNDMRSTISSIRESIGVSPHH